MRFVKELYHFLCNCEQAIRLFLGIISISLFLNDILKEFVLHNSKEFCGPSFETPSKESRADSTLECVPWICKGLLLFRKERASYLVQGH